MLKQLCTYLLFGLVAGLLLWSCGTGPIAPPPNDQVEPASGPGGDAVASDNDLDNDTARLSGGDTDTGANSDVVINTDSAVMDSETGTRGDTVSDTSSESTVDTAVDSATSTASDSGGGTDAGGVDTASAQDSATGTDFAADTGTSVKP